MFAKQYYVNNKNYNKKKIWINKTIDNFKQTTFRYSINNNDSIYN